MSEGQEDLIETLWNVKNSGAAIEFIAVEI